MGYTRSTTHSSSGAHSCWRSWTNLSPLACISLIHMVFLCSNSSPSGGVGRPTPTGFFKSSKSGFCSSFKRCFSTQSSISSQLLHIRFVSNAGKGTSSPSCHTIMCAWSEAEHMISCLSISRQWLQWSQWIGFKYRASLYPVSQACHKTLSLRSAYK